MSEKCVNSCSIAAKVHIFSDYCVPLCIIYRKHLSNFVPNPFFQFKQFTVHHDRCAMKVGTDGVLVGAWADVGNVRRIIDIGTGTGLIALMLAQRCPQATVLGIDIDTNAVSQARENVEKSPFGNRVEIEHIAVQDLAVRHEPAFDLAVSNPPFFSRSLHSPARARTIARHTELLPLESLFASAAQLLSEEGRFSVIYPISNLPEVLDYAAQHGFFLHRQSTVFPIPKAPPKRVLLEFSKQYRFALVYNELVIETERHRYSEDFRTLVKDFYFSSSLAKYMTKI